jgi:hypothetical protein
MEQKWSTLMTMEKNMVMNRVMDREMYREETQNMCRKYS